MEWDEKLDEQKREETKRHRLWTWTFSCSGNKTSSATSVNILLVGIFARETKKTSSFCCVQIETNEKAICWNGSSLRVFLFYWRQIEHAHSNSGEIINIQSFHSGLKWRAKKGHDKIGKSSVFNWKYRKMIGFVVVAFVFVVVELNRSHYAKQKLGAKNERKKVISACCCM